MFAEWDPCLFCYEWVLLAKEQLPSKMSNKKKMLFETNHNQGNNLGFMP